MQEYHSKIHTQEGTAQDTLNAQADNKYDLSPPKWIELGLEDHQPGTST